MRRRKHLTERDCRELSQSSEGSSSLTRPLHQWSSGRDVNRGLYPRSRKKTGPKMGNSWSDRVHSSMEGPSQDPPSSSTSSAHTANTDAEDAAAALCSGHIDDEPAVDDGTDSSWPRPSPSKKRSSSESWDRDWNGDPPGEDDLSSSGNFYEEEDDDEMGHLLDSLPDSHYGLLGDADANRQSYDLLSRFPDELLQHIFGFLPIEDLYQNVSLVCKEWRELVDDRLFIPWKKLYHRYITKEPMSMAQVRCIFFQNNIASGFPDHILSLVRGFASVFQTRPVDFRKILDSLKYHHLYQMAEKSASARFPDLRDNTGTMNAWAIVAVLVLLSRDVPDIQKLVTCLHRPSSPLKLPEIMEALYCLALLVYAMREEKVPISNRIHYNIFYCLYLLENASSQIKIVPRSSSRNKPSFRLTNEQQQIINHNIQPGQVVKIMAFAGTGKTSTLIKYAEKRPGLRFLYVTFNKSIANHAINVFPQNVTCRTFHSLAFQETGRLYLQRKKINPSKLTPYTVNFVLPEGQAGFVRAKLVVKTLENFFASADYEIESDHVPIWCKSNRGERKQVSPAEQQFTVREATKIWERMKSLDEVRELAYKMTHDGYLKLWQIRQPDLSSYDVIFIDEAQDCTPSIMEVVLKQTCGKIFVGDPHQQIYTFRGAVNALCEVPHTHIFYLTQSFRFGAEIAYIGATILDVAKKIRNKILVGGTQTGTVREPAKSKAAILSRSNACVFDQAVTCTESPSRIHIIGGADHFGLSKIYDIWLLQQPEVERNKHRPIEDKFIRTWLRRGGYAALREYTVSSEDRELEGKIIIVEKYNRRIPELVMRIKACNTTDAESADYILGTVHKAKGMEFDTVVVTDDFVKVPLPNHDLVRVGIPLNLSVEDEWNLLYVAVTRAKKHLVITKSIRNILTMAGEYLLQAELTSEVLKEGPVVCGLAHCRNPIPENSVLTMRRLPVAYSDKSEDKGGIICHTCVHQRIQNMTKLMLLPEVMDSMNIKVEPLIIPRHIEALLQAI